MYSRVFWATAVVGMMGGVASAQSFERRANFTGGGRPGEGRCTIEVVVDGAAEVEIRGDRAILRNLNGRPAEWRRFECNVPMPGNPVEFHFQGIDGRGSQQLIRDPSRGGGAAGGGECPKNRPRGPPVGLGSG